MLDVTPSDISNLGDEDLRTLVARLCEAELRGANLPVSALTAGGNQNAADGGLDVRVRLVSGYTGGAFIPRASTGFQVKVPDMRRSAILEEMAPGGVLRSVIAELVEAQGAYIIVCSKASTTDSRLAARLAAMAEAVSSLPDPSQIKLDFYDSDRIARWTRTYPGVSAWVRERVGRPIQGWQPFGNWSTPSATRDDKYLIDDRARIRDGRNPSDGELSINEGIKRIREILAREKGIVRLIGLSGLGKTRLVQALFDGNIGGSILDSALVFYTDMAHGPQPSPRDVLRIFVTSRQRVILVVDNCKPETHRALVSVCGESDSQASLITVEYDVGDDEPEDTNVFRLDPASEDVIDKLIEFRSPQISQVDRRRIAEFSGGNARIALSLAWTVQPGDQISRLTDRDLISRLFHQGRSEDTSLLRAAEACALVYSFDGETISGEKAELPVLANLAGQTVDELHRHIAELKRRDLVQQRGEWRAVLPHALANKFAHKMLEQSIVENVETALVARGRERLAKSFARRLGYLHDCAQAKRIVEGWLKDDGLLSAPHAFAPLGWAMFEWVAPVVPEKTLDVLERSLQGEGRVVITDLSHPARHHFPPLLRSLAYDETLFDRSAKLLQEFVLAEPADHNQDSAKATFTELFRLYLSGTHATFEQRADVISAMLNDSNSRAVACGLDAIDSMLEAGHFSSSHRFEFGARSRDHGWAPRTIGEVDDWYRRAVELLVAHWKSRPSIKANLRSILAANLRSLWSRVRIQKEVESAIHTISEHDGWIEGWLTVKEILRFDRRRMSDEYLAPLLRIEERLRPRDLIGLTRAYALSDAWNAIDAVADGNGEEESASVYRAADNRTVEIGKAAAQNLDVLRAVLPDLLSGSTHGRRHPFGMGLADGASDFDEMWRMLVDGLEAVPSAERNIGVLCGFLFQAKNLDQAFRERVLDAAIADTLLAFWFPTLQGCILIDDRAADRLMESLRVGAAPIHRYSYLPIWGDAPIMPGKVAELLDVISKVPGGCDVAIDTLQLHLHSLKDAGRAIPVELVACGQRLLEKIEIGKMNANADYRVGVVMKSCLTGPDAASCAAVLCKNVLGAVAAGSSVYGSGEMLRGIFRMQPDIALESFFGTKREGRARWLMEDYSYAKGSPLDEVPVETAIVWANKIPNERYTRLAQVITIFRHDDGEGDQALTPASIALLNACPNKSDVLAEYEDRLRPMTWSGSLAQILTRRSAALEALMTDADPMVADWAARSRRLLLDRAQNERDHFREEDESFE